MSSTQLFKDVLDKLNLSDRDQRWVVVTTGVQRVIGRMTPSKSVVTAGMIYLEPAMEYAIQVQMKPGNVERTAHVLPLDITDGFCGLFVRPDRILVISDLDDSDKKVYLDLIRQGLSGCMSRAAKSSTGLVL